MKHSLRTYFLAATLAILPGCSNDSKRDKGKVPYTPDETINYVDDRGVGQKLDLFIIDPAKIRSLIRRDNNLADDAEIDFRDYAPVVLKYIDDRLKQMNEFDSGVSRQSIRGLIVRRLLDPNPGLQPMKLGKDSYETEGFWGSRVDGHKASLLFFPDSDGSSQEWCASWLRVDSQAVKEDTGINDEILETFIRHHEIGHALGFGEAAADHYASHAVISDYGLTDEVFAFLQFKSDVRLITRSNSRYLGCHDAVETVLATLPEDAIDLKTTRFIPAGGKPSEEDAITMQHPDCKMIACTDGWWNRIIQKPEDVKKMKNVVGFQYGYWHLKEGWMSDPFRKASAVHADVEGSRQAFSFIRSGMKDTAKIWATIYQEGDTLDPNGDHLRLYRERALAASSYEFDDAIEAIDRMMTLLKSSDEISAYAQIHRVSDPVRRYGKEFPGPLTSAGQNDKGYLYTPENDALRPK